MLKVETAGAANGLGAESRPSPPDAAKKAQTHENVLLALPTARMVTYCSG